MEDIPTPTDISTDATLECLNLGKTQPNDLAAEITDAQCQNLGVSTGLDGSQNSNCDDLSDMMCLIKQCVDAIATEQAMVIAPNDASKCQDDNDPTLASFWSRVLRWCQAVTCILCEYDPFVATILKSGRYPQILMGSMGDNGYPQWVMPDEVPTDGSHVPVMSGGVVKAVQEAILSVWHLWEEYPEFTFFAHTLNSDDDFHPLVGQEGASEGDTALVEYDGTDYNVLYAYTSGAWKKTKVLTAGDGLTNFATTHIVKGYYADKGVYYFHDGDKSTWNVMDVEVGQLEERLQQLEQATSQVVTSAKGDENIYALTTVATMEEAEAVECDPERTVIVFVTG